MRRLEGEETSSKVRKSLNAELFDLRVDLNYVMVRPLLASFSSAIILCISELPETGEVHLPLPS